MGLWGGGLNASTTKYTGFVRVKERYENGSVDVCIYTDEEDNMRYRWGPTCNASNIQAEGAGKKGKCIMMATEHQ